MTLISSGDGKGVFRISVDGAAEKPQPTNVNDSKDNNDGDELLAPDPV